MIWLLVVLYRTAINFFIVNKDPVVLGILSGVTVFLAHNLIDIGIYNLQLVALFWFILGLLIAVININSNSENKRVSFS